MNRLAPRAYRYPAIALLGGVLAASAPRSCGQQPSSSSCDLCTADEQPRWPVLIECLTGGDAGACADDCERCMRQVYKSGKRNCSYEWTQDCVDHVLARCPASACGTAP